MTPLSAAPGVDPQDQWQRFCSLLWHSEAMGFWLDVSRMGLDAAQLDELRPRFTTAFEAMAALESLGSCCRAAWRLARQFESFPSTHK